MTEDRIQLMGLWLTRIVMLVGAITLACYGKDDAGGALFLLFIISFIIL